MNSNPIQSLLSPDDPLPVRVVNSQASSAFLLLGDHAGNLIPRKLGTLGLSKFELARHIGWDIGVANLGAALAEKIDATFLSQTFSRLVIDCNRDPAEPDAIPTTSDGTYVPGNEKLSTDERRRRAAEIHVPYQAAIANELAARDSKGRSTFLVSLHSFTPTLEGVTRPWDIGVLHSDGQTGFAQALLGILERTNLRVGDNQPYAMDSTDYTVPRHAFGARRHYAEIEIRQDLLATPELCKQWSELLATMLASAARGIDAGVKGV